jgi:hypothetical protein
VVVLEVDVVVEPPPTVTGIQEELEPPEQNTLK